VGNLANRAKVIDRLLKYCVAALLLATCLVLIFTNRDVRPPHEHKKHPHHPVNPYQGPPDSYQGSHTEWNGLPGFEGPFSTSSDCEIRMNSQATTKQIYGTLLLTDDYLIAVLKLRCSLKRVASIRPLVVFYHNISQATLTTLHSYGLQTKTIKLLSYPNYFAKRFSTNWSKLRFWEMVEYDRIVYLDSDMIVLQNIDPLFSLPAPFAVPPDNERYACGGPMGFNQAGLLVITPCVETYQQMIAIIETNTTLQFRNSDAEQGFLNYYFQNTRILLPSTYNVLPHKSWNTPLREQAKVIHYTANKPFAPTGWTPLAKYEPYHYPWLNCTDY